MPDSIENFTVQEEIMRLEQIVGDVVDSLRTQRDLLRQRGMGLPPGTLGSLKNIQTELTDISGQLAGETIELTQLRALADTTALVNSSLDIDQVLNEVMDTVIRLTGAERGYIMLRDDYSGEMELRIARNLDRKTIDQSEFIVSRTIVEEVTQSGQPVVTTNAQSDPRFSAQESVLIYALRSILCVPLVLQGDIIGVVYADNRIRDALFAEKELSLLTAFADQAAIAIQNARLFQRVQLALAEITEMKELMDNVFASITSGVITSNIQNVVTTYNNAAERILDVPYNLVIGYAMSDALPVIYTNVDDCMGLVHRQGFLEMLEIDPVLPNRGQVNLNLKLTPLRNAENVTEGVAFVVDDLTDIKQRDSTLAVVRRYLPPAMVDNIQSIDELGLGGERRVITVVFVETRPFHAFSPDLSPQALMELLNLYLTVGAEAIHNQTGVIDKFMGNELMGLFNTQLNPSENHAWWAIQAALKMASDFVTLAERLGGDPNPYYRIGIHTGLATLGNVGTSRRREFTAIGDTINLGKRLQENALPGQIIISADTYDECRMQLVDPSNGILLIERPSIQVKGRRQATKILEIVRN
ncbi:MAG: GAF domain-containing protein [Anaerolineae bacterium]|nr:GAF domain-containing protein [Anaerolineae bacterium]